MNSARTIKLRTQAPKPRNPLVAPALQRKAGKHRKSNKAQRAILKQGLRKELEPR
jgi:hypothetical protein